MIKEPLLRYIEGSMHDITASYGILSSSPNRATAIEDKGYIYQIKIIFIQLRCKFIFNI